MMEKLAWACPQTTVEIFQPDEYVAACGDGHKTYNFVCNAGEWAGLTGYSTWIDPDGIPENGDEIYLSDYAACGATHEVDDDPSQFVTGYIKKNLMGVPVGSPKKVIIWRGPNGNNTHCTTKLEISSWEVAKS